jgi:hypothetical protein
MRCDVDSAVRRYTKALSEYHSELYAKRNGDGVIMVLQKGFRYIPYEIDDTIVHVASSSPTYVFAITDTWTTQGRPVDWGLDQVVRKAKDCDYRSRENLLKELEEVEEKADKSKAREFKNHAEAFFSDTRSAFKKATSDILTHSMSKTETKAQKKRRLKDGNY